MKTKNLFKKICSVLLAASIVIGGVLTTKVDVKADELDWGYYLFSVDGRSSDREEGNADDMVFEYVDEEDRYLIDVDQVIPKDAIICIDNLSDYTLCVTLDGEEIGSLSPDLEASTPPEAEIPPLASAAKYKGMDVTSDKVTLILETTEESPIIEEIGVEVYGDAKEGYEIGNPILKEDFRVYAIYNDDTTKTLSPEDYSMDVSMVDITKPGEYDVIFVYGEFSKTVKVKYYDFSKPIDELEITEILLNKQYSVGDKVEASDFAVKISKDGQSPFDVPLGYVGIGTSVNPGEFDEDGICLKEGECTVFVKAFFQEPNSDGSNWVAGKQFIITVGFKASDEKPNEGIDEKTDEKTDDKKEDSESTGRLEISEISLNKHYSVGDKVNARDFAVKIVKDGQSPTTVPSKYIGVGTSVKPGEFDNNGTCLKAGKCTVFVKVFEQEPNSDGSNWVAGQQFIITVGPKSSDDNKEDKKEYEQDEDKEEKPEEKSSSEESSPVLTEEQKAIIKEEAQGVVGSVAYLEKQEEIKQSITKAALALSSLSSAQQRETVKTAVSLNFGGCTTIDKTTAVLLATNNKVPYNIEFTWKGLSFVLRIPAGKDITGLLDSNGDLPMWKIVEKYGILSSTVISIR